MSSVFWTRFYLASSVSGTCFYLCPGFFWNPAFTSCRFLDLLLPRVQLFWTCFYFMTGILLTCFYLCRLPDLLLLHDRHTLYLLLPRPVFLDLLLLHTAYSVPAFTSCPASCTCFYFMTGIICVPAFTS